MEEKSMKPVVSLEASKQFRAAFIGEFEGHHTLSENSDNIHEIEAGESNLPDDYTLQRIVACYEGVQVWLLNDDGPLQAFYTKSETWGEPGDFVEVAREVESYLL